MQHVFISYIRKNKGEVDRLLQRVNLGKIVKISADGDYIYRGEPEYYEKALLNSLSSIGWS